MPRSKHTYLLALRKGVEAKTLKQVGRDIEKVAGAEVISNGHSLLKFAATPRAISKIKAKLSTNCVFEVSALRSRTV